MHLIAIDLQKAHCVIMPEIAVMVALAKHWLLL
jgi:hypothetical protein